MPIQPVLDAFGGNLRIVGTGASTANQHAPHFADDVASLKNQSGDPQSTHIRYPRRSCRRSLFGSQKHVYTRRFFL